VNEKNGRAGTNQPERKFSDLLDSKWPDYLNNQAVKSSTRYSYNAILNKWIKPFFSDLFLEDIGADTVGRFMAQLAKNNLSAKYRRNVYNLLKLLFEIALEYDLMLASPVRPRVHRPVADRASIAGLFAGTNNSHHCERGSFVSSGARHSGHYRIAGWGAVGITLEGLRFHQPPFHDCKHGMEGKTSDNKNRVQ